MMDKSKRFELKDRYIIYFSMFIMGGCGLTYEYTLSKMSSYMLGNTTQQWAIIIGVMMFFMGVGSDIQKYLKDEGIFDKFIFFEVLLGLLGGIGPIAMLYTYGKANTYFVLVQYFLIGSIGLLIGLEIPLLTRINEKYTHELRFNIGAILKMDYIGSLCGALLWVFILPKFFTIVQTAIVLGLLTVSTAVAALVYFRHYVINARKMAVCSGMVLLGLTFSLYHANSWTTHAEQYLFRDRVVLSKTTRFQHIVVTESPNGNISCFLNGHLQFNSSTEHFYHENLVHPAMTVVRRRDTVLVLGGGDGLAVREILKYPDVRSITLVDIDPEMTELAQKSRYFTELNENSLLDSRLKHIPNKLGTTGISEKVIMENQKRFNVSSEGQLATVEIVNIDAAKFVEQIPGRYDVIVIDFPDPNSQELARLYSNGFYRRVKERLHDYGIMVQQSTSPIHAKEAFLCIGRTMKDAGFTAIPYHDNVPSFGEWGWWICAKRSAYTEKELRHQLKNIDAMRVDTRYLTADLVRASMIFGKNQLYSDKSDITTLTRTTVHDYYLQGWLEDY